MSEEVIDSKLLREEVKRKQDIVFNLKIDVEKQRREFYQNLTILLGAIIGLESSWGYENILNKNYFITGVVCYIIFVLIVSIHFKKILDDELNYFQHKEDVNSIYGEEVEKYLKTSQDRKVSTFLNSFKRVPIIENLKRESEKENNELLEGRKKRLEGKSWYFTGEIFLSFFTVSSLFIVISFLPYTINLPTLFFIIFVLLVIIFTSFTDFLINNLNKFINIVINLPKKS